MESSSREKNQRKFLDSRKSILSRIFGYFKRREFVIFASVFALLLFLTVFRSFLTSAEVVDFYPSTCLGDWHNPLHVQGKPENFGIADSNFTEGNSSVFTGGESKIFCGGFLNPEFEKKGNITHVGLTLVWQVGDGEIVPQLEGATISPEEDIVVTSTPEHKGGILATSTSEFNENPSLENIKGDQGGKKDIREEQQVTSTDPSQSQQRIPRKHASLFQKIILSAYAEENQTASETSTTTEINTNTEIPLIENSEAPPDRPIIIVAPPISISLDPIVVSSSEDVIPTTNTLPELFPNVEETKETDNDFLQVDYSFDGENWLKLAQINQSNWKNFTVALPLQTWEEIEKVQVRIQGIPTTLEEIPKILLDGILLEVHYEIISPLTEQEEEKREEKLQEISEKEPEIVIHDEGATHSCDIRPFSKTVRPGEETTFIVHLTPSNENEPQTSQLDVGRLPRGLEIHFEERGGEFKNTKTLFVSAAPDARKGSFSLILVYREVQPDFTTIGNFCQFNLVIE